MGVLALSAGAAGTAAEAQVTSVVGASTTQVQLDSLFSFNGGGPGLVTQGGGAAYYSSYASTPTKISFESANASLRGDNQVMSTSSTSVDITIKNGGASAVVPMLQSTITGAGLGVYLADTGGACAGSGLFSGGDPYGGCGQTKSGQTFANLPKIAGFAGPVAGAEFEFKVTAGGTTVYDLTGVEQLVENADGLHVSGLQQALTVNGVSADPTGVLQGLTNTTPGPAGSANGWLWNDSNVDISLVNALAAGASEDVVYTATVTTFSLQNCVAAAPTVCLVPYASFGDPIGGAGAISGKARIFGGALTDFGLSGPLGSSSDGIPYVDNWAPQTFDAPRFDFNTGTLTFGVPEPATWMSMILGFGLLGAALRRRRVLGYT